MNEWRCERQKKETNATCQSSDCTSAERTNKENAGIKQREIPAVRGVWYRCERGEINDENDDGSENTTEEWCGKSRGARRASGEKTARQGTQQTVCCILPPFDWCLDLQVEAKQW